MENLNFEVDEDLTVEEVELEKNRVMADPKHSLHHSYWTGNDPNHKHAIAYVQAHYDRISELRNPIETPPAVDHPLVENLDPDLDPEDTKAERDAMKARLEAMKANPEVQKILARGKKHPAYAATQAEMTALFQAVYDQEGELENSVKAPDLEEGRLDLTDLPGDIGDQYLKQVDYIDSLIDRASNIEDVKKAFFAMYDKYGDPDRRDEAEEKVEFYVRNHGNLADRLNREILKNALTAAFKA